MARRKSGAFEGSGAAQAGKVSDAWAGAERQSKVKKQAAEIDRFCMVNPF